MSNIRWEGDDIVARNMGLYAQKVTWAITQIANYFAAVIEAYAKENAPWTDQTANARQSLYAFVETQARETVNLYLSHGMDYGIYLETRWAGRYAIIWPTIQAHLPQITRMLRETFR